MADTILQSDDLDRASLDMLADLIAPSDMCELVALYLDQIGERIARIRELSAAGDCLALAKEAHVVISTAGNLGMPQVSALARTIEEACKAGDRDGSRRLVDELIPMSGRASEALRAWRDAKTATVEKAVA